MLTSALNLILLAVEVIESVRDRVDNVSMSDGGSSRSFYAYTACGSATALLLCCAQHEVCSNSAYSFRK